MIKYDWPKIRREIAWNYMYFGWRIDMIMETVSYIPGPGHIGDVPETKTYSTLAWVYTSNWKYRFIPIRKMK